ncbi:microtubule-associated protein futsch isoform X2 [Lolium rigidum]|uniref:microtubule-associated protein futsch isoform X2 n=1 Tax=Lolium rigidum TaxID=89674 RepID=UPI001F5D3336|nr:microtubule-associated protein futsch isoform X2 [Lolium rigidum]
MVTEEEAREAADGEEVQVEVADLGTTHLQVNLDSKLSSHGDIKEKGKIMDSTEGILRVTEDQVFEKAPSVAEIPLEHTPNGTASSLNGHMKEAKISNEKPQENGQKDNEQVEASSDGINTDQSNKSNGKETVDSFSHIESTTEDTSLLKSENEEPKEHYEQDVEGAAVEDKMVQKDTLQADEPTVPQQGQNLELAKVTEDTQHASTSCNPHDEVVADAPAGVQTSHDPNADDSAPLPDATDGNTETEPAKVDKESFPEDEDIAEHTNEIIKLEDQPSKQADDVDADLVQEEVPKSKKTDMPEDMTTTEQAHESTNGDQEVLNQESPEDTSDPVHEKTEETSHESNVSASEETTPEHDATAREPALDVQEVQSQGLAEEIADAKEVDTGKTVQESGVAFEEATSKDNIPTIEPSSDIQHPNSVESEEIKGLEDAKAEETSNQSNVTIAEDTKDKEATEAIQPVQGLEEEPKNSGTAEMDEASNEPLDVLNNLAEEDGVPACQPQVIELEDVKNTGVTETQEITQQSHVAASEELETEDNSREIESSNDDIQLILEQGSVEVKDTESSETQEICNERSISASEDHVEDDVTAEGPTSDAQKVKNVESAEEIKDNTADDIVEASNVATVEEADQQNNVLTSEDVSEQKMRGLEPEEIQNTEPVETEEASDQRHPAQEDIIPSDMLKTESTAEVTGTEATKTKALPQESNVSISDEPASEENATASEITCDAQKVNNLEQAEDVEGNKDTRAKETSDQSSESNVASLEEIATEDSTTILTDVSIQQLEEQEPVEFRGTETTEPQGISSSHIVSTTEDSASEDKVKAEPSLDTAENLESAPVTKETKDVKSHVQELEAPVQTPPVEEPELEETKNTDNQMDATVLEDPTHEDDPTTSKSLVIESAEGSSSGATEGQEMPQVEVARSEDHEAEENMIASEPEILEPEPADEMRDSEATEPQSISQQSIVSSSEESVPEEDVTAREPVSDIKEVQTEEPELIDENNDVKAGEISNQSSGTIVGDAAQENLESATGTEETREVKSTDVIAEEKTAEELVQEFEGPVDIPPVDEPELEETKNTEPVEVHDNVTTNELPAEEVNDTEATEIAEIQNECADLTEDVKSNVPLADQAAPDEHAKAIEATADIPQVQEPELEDIKNSEHVEVEDNIIASDLPKEEIKDIEAMETEMIPDETTGANISELTNAVKSNVALAEEAAPEEHGTETEATIDIPQAQEPELEEVKNTEPDEMEENISATDQSAEEIKASEAMETEAVHESIDANNSKLAEDLEDDAAHEEHVIAAETTVQIPRAQEPELEEIKNSEPVEVKENMSASDLPAEEVNETEATENKVINKNTDANTSEPTEDANRNVAVADEAAPEEHVIATEATVDIPRAQEAELEETKNAEHVEVEENITATDLPAEEVEETEDTETEVISESTDANISEPTEDANRNAVADEATPEELVIATEATADIPPAQEPELEEIENAEHVEVEESITASNLPAEEGKETQDTETEVISKSTDANISEPTDDVKKNGAVADEAAPEEHLIATEETVDISRAQEPGIEEIENSEHVEVEENISASDLPAEEVKETEVISESTDANITEPTEDAKINVALADEAAPEQHVIATEATVDIPRAQEPELEETENAEHFEVEVNISANDLPAEEVKGTETMETGAISNSTDANITELTEDVALANEAVPDIHVDIPPAQEPALEEINNTEPVEAEDSITADDVPAEEINETKFMETEEIPHESTDDSLTASAPLADIQQAPEQEAVKDKCTDTTQNQTEPQQSIVSTAAEPTRTEEKPTVTELASDVQQVLERDSTEETTGIEDVHTEDDQQHGVSNLEKPVSENDVSESEPNVADQEVQEDKTAEVEDTAAMEAEEISTQDNIPTTENAAQESSEPGNDPDLLVQSEDIKEELLKAEETGQSNGATLEEQTAEDNAANETDPLADTKQVHGLESVKEYSSVDATEGEEASHPTSQDAGLEEIVSESNVATTEPTSDIQQVDDLDEAGEMMATEAINDEEISYPKTEAAPLEDPSPTDNGMSPKQNSVELDQETLGTEINNAEPIEQKDESSDIGEKTAFTTQKGESPTEEDDVQSSGDDTVGISNNIEQIKEQSKAVTEDDAIKSGEHTIDQDDEQLHSVELQLQVCERSVDVSAIEQPDDDVQKVNLGQQQKEDEVIKEQAEEIQRDEQKHDDSSTELTTETLLEHQSNEIGTTNWNEDTDMFEAEKTETVATEMLMNEQTPHIQQGSTPAIADAKVENSTEIKETPEQENAPNNTSTLYTDADAENHNEDEKENLETDAAVVKPSTDEQDGTTDETENPTVVPRNVEPKVHSEEKACINKANDGMQAIQASQEEIVDEVENKQEMQNEDTCVNNDEIQTKPLNEDASKLHSNDNTDIKMDDTISPFAEMTHGRIDAQPTEIEEVEENKGFRSISEYAVQCSNQNDVEHNLSIHPKVVDDNLATTEQSDAEVETNSNEEMATSCTAVTEAVKFDEAINNKANGADGALSDENLETSEDNRRNLEASSAVTSLGESMNEGNEHHNLALPAHSAVDGNTAEQASGLEVTERGLLFPEKPLPAESEEHEESQTTKEQNEEDIHEQETSDTEKEEKEDEQSDLPVSNFLMNLIMGKESTKPDSNLETEAEMKQEETTKDDSGLINSQQEESLVPIPTEYKVDNKLIFEQGKHNLEGSEETHDFKLESDEELSRNTHELEAPVSQNNVQDEISGELVPGGPGLMTEVESRNVKLGERATNSVCQEHMEAATQIEGGLKSNIDDSTNPKASQKNTLEGTTDLRHESLPEERSSDAVARQALLATEPDTGDEEKLPNDTDDLKSPLSTKREESTESSIIEAESTIKAEQENEVEKEEEKHHTINASGSTGGEIENLHDDSQKRTDAISDEKMAEITELDIGTEINLVDEKEISAGSKCEDKKQSSYELPNSELDSSEKALDIQSDGSSLHINQDKQDEFAGDQIVMEKNSLLDKPGKSNLHEEQEAEFGQESPKESDGGGQNCLAIREPVIEEENVNRTVESHVQTVNTKSNEEQETYKPQVQERDFDVVSAKEALEAEENFVEMAKPELSTDAERSQKEDKLNMAGEKTYDEKTKDGEEAKSFTDEATTKIEEQGALQKASHNQTRDLNVVLPTKAPGSEESFVDIKTPEFSTDEEQSPKKGESKMAEEKSSDKRTNSDEEAKNFTDETPIKIEEREAGQKASPKKHNILSGVGSKVKHQLAKVKKAIIGKPGHTKSELAKS